MHTRNVDVIVVSIKLLGVLLVILIGSELSLSKTSYHLQTTPASTEEEPVVSQ